MDLKLYFHKIRTVEATIPGEHAVVVSLETTDGGKPGQLSEVSRAVAAKLVVQGKARLASQEEADEFYTSVRAASRAAADQFLKEHLHLSLIPEGDLESLRSILRKQA